MTKRPAAEGVKGQGAGRFFVDRRLLYICGRQSGGEGWACDASTVMIAEKGTDMILGKPALARTAA